MKKICIAGFVGLLFFTACENTGSSSVGSYEKEETSQSSDKSENEGHSGQAIENGQSGTENTGTVTTDTSLKVSGDAPHEASGAEIKTGASVSADTTNNPVPKH